MDVENTNSTRVFVADDHEVVRGGIRRMIESAPDMVVVGEASNGRDALQQIELTPIDVALLDVSMPDLNGIELVRVLRSRRLPVCLLMLSMHATGEFVSAIAAGADGYLLKEASRDEILGAIREVRTGGRHIASQLRQQYGSDKSGSLVSPIDKLSMRERQVLQLVVEGKSSAEIAAIVHLSPKSVDTYRSRLMKKLGLANVPELVKFAVQHGLTPLT
jgi:DNA-binding NarL/FixJ family response regulator